MTVVTKDIALRSKGNCDIIDKLNYIESAL